MREMIKNYRNYIPVLGLIITYILTRIGLGFDYVDIMFYILFINPLVFGFLSILLNAIKYKTNEKYAESTIAILIQLVCYIFLLVYADDIGATLLTIYFIYILTSEFLIMLVFFVIEKCKKSKVLRIAAIVLAALLIFYVSIDLAVAHVWKLWGFKKCESPDSLVIETVYVTDENVNVIGMTPGSALRYNGYKYKVIDETLYLGVCYQIYAEGWAGFSLEIEEDFSNLKNVVLTNGENEKCIWTVEKDKKYMEKINKVRLYKSVFVDHNYDYYKEQMKIAEFVSADVELLNRIQHPTFSNELYITKSNGYLGVAELSSGEELYLEFAVDGDWYNVIGSSAHYNY